MSNDGALVMLGAGNVAPLEAIELLWRLEGRGLSVEMEGARLAIGPRHLISDHDRQEIRRLSGHLQTLVTSRAPEQ